MCSRAQDFRKTYSNRKTNRADFIRAVVYVADRQHCDYHLQMYININKIEHVNDVYKLVSDFPSHNNRTRVDTVGVCVCVCGEHCESDPSIFVEVCGE